MNLGRSLFLKVAGLLIAAPAILAASDAATTPRTPIALSARRAVASGMQAQAAKPLAAPACSGLCYSTEISQVALLQGQALYRTAIDLTNNTENNGVIARVQYSYTCTGCAGGGFFRTNPIVIPLAGLDNFHSDDMVTYLASQPQTGLAADAVNGAIGTLLVTFDNLPSTNGWEGTAIARLYNRVNENDPNQGTVGYAFPGSLFFESAHMTQVAIVRDTSSPDAAAANTQGSQRTNLGVRNTDIDGDNFPGTDRHVSITVQLFDPTTGNAVGSALNTTNMLPGEVRIFGNVFQLAGVPANVNEAIAFIDVQSPTESSPTIESFVVTIDNTTVDGSYFDAKCADQPYTCGQ